MSKNLKEINAAASELRDEKNALEMDLAALYNETRDLPDKIALSASDATFVVKRPNQWKKGWTLSKKTLESYLKELIPAQAEQLMAAIIAKHEPTLIADDYGFEVVMSLKRD